MLANCRALSVFTSRAFQCLQFHFIAFCSLQIVNIFCKSSSLEYTYSFKVLKQHFGNISILFEENLSKLPTFHVTATAALETVGIFSGHLDQVHRAAQELTDPAESPSPQIFRRRRLLVTNQRRELRLLTNQRQSMLPEAESVHRQSPHDLIKSQHRQGQGQDSRLVKRSHTA